MRTQSTAGMMIITSTALATANSSRIDSSAASAAGTRCRSSHSSTGTSIRLMTIATVTGMKNDDPALSANGAARNSPKPPRMTIADSSRSRRKFESCWIVGAPTSAAISGSASGSAPLAIPKGSRAAFDRSGIVAIETTMNGSVPVTQEVSLTRQAA